MQAKRYHVLISINWHCENVDYATTGYNNVGTASQVFCVAVEITNGGQPHWIGLTVVCLYVARLVVVIV